MPGQQLLVYRDDAWFPAYNGMRKKPSEAEDGSSLMQCDERASGALRNASIPKGRFYGEAGTVLSDRIVQDEPSFWFFSVARCAEWVDGVHEGDSCTGTYPADWSASDIPSGIFLYYELVLLNPGGFWERHFSADEQGLFEVQLLVMAVYGIMLTALLLRMAMRYLALTRREVRPASEAPSTVCTHRLPCRTRARGTRVPG